MRDTWTLCGNEVDASFVKFIVQITGCFLVMLFAMVGCFVDARNFTVYTNLISVTVGYLAPGPSHPNRHKNLLRVETATTERHASDSKSDNAGKKS